RADDGRDRELALADQRLWIDGEPRLASGCEHVVPVQVLVEQHLLTLRRRKRGQRVDGRVNEPALDRPIRALPLLRQVAAPPGSLVFEGMKRFARLDPEPRQ